MPRRKNKSKKASNFRQKLQQKLSISLKFAKKYRPQLLILALVLLVFLAVAAWLVRPQDTEPEAQQPQPKKVNTLAFGQQAAKQQTTGQIKNLSTVTLVAQTAGPVDQVLVVEGDQVSNGKWLVTQETAYAAGNAAPLQTRQSYNQWLQAKETFDSLADTYDTRRTQIDLTAENVDELRKLQETSIGETKNIISTLENQVEYYNDLLEGANTEADQATYRAQVITYQSQINSQRSALRNLEYETNQDNPPVKLSDIQQQLAIEALQLEYDTKRLARDIAWLGYQQARIQEARTRAMAPFAGVVEKVHKQPGEYANPGDPLITLRGDTKLCLVIPVSGSLAKQIDSTAALQVQLDTIDLTVPINHVTSTQVSGSLYEVLTIIPQQYYSHIYEGQTVPVELPLFDTNQVSQETFIPLTAVYVTNTGRYVLALEDGKAVRKDITTGKVVGDQVAVRTGLDQGTEVILDRSVVAGSLVEAE